jgi:hypothetical protein
MENDLNGYFRVPHGVVCFCRGALETWLQTEPFSGGTQLDFLFLCGTASAARSSDHVQNSLRSNVQNLEVI